MTTRLSKNFTLAELTVTNTGINNQPSFQEYDVITDRLRRLSVNVLQKVRDRFGPTKVNSAFRNEEVNKKVGGVANSQHRLGEAADIWVPGHNLLTVARWIEKNLNFDQLILENYVGGDGSRGGWIHVSYRQGKNRRQVLTKPKGTSSFSKGLPTSDADAAVETIEANTGKLAAVAAGLGAVLVYMMRKRK